MLSFRSLQEVEEACLAPGLRRAARDALSQLVLSVTGSGFPFDPDDHGFVVLIDDTGEDPGLDRVLGVPFADALFEDVGHDRKAGAFVVTIMGCSDFGLTVLVRDTPRLSHRVREKLLAWLPEGEAAG